MSDAERVILVVDDEALVRWALRQRLEEGGYHVLQASTADGALGQAAQADLVLMEMELPDGDGRVLARRLRSVHPRQSLVLMTAWSGPELERLAADGVVDAVVEKPFSLDELQQIVRECLHEQ